MVAVVFFVLLLLVGLGLFLFGSYTDSYTKKRVNFHWAGVIPVAVAFMILFFSAYQPVGAREVGIPETFGHLGADLQPGAHLVAPWANIHKCSLSQQQSILTQAPSEGDKSGNDGIAVNGNDQGQGIADTIILYHFDAGKAFQLYRKYACDEERVKTSLIRPATKSVVPSLAAQYPSLDIKAKRTEIGQAAVPLMQKIVGDDGIVVDQVLISEIVLSKATQDAADAKLAAQQGAQQAAFTLQKAETDAKTAQVNAQAAQQANDQKAKSLSPAILCEDWINMLAQAKPTSIFVNGPCGTGSADLGGLILNTGK